MMSTELRGKDGGDTMKHSVRGGQSYIELFARDTTSGWDARGNEVNKEED